MNFNHKRDSSRMLATVSVAVLAFTSPSAWAQEASAPEPAPANETI